MSSTLAKPSFGIILEMSDAAGTNFTPIAEVKDLNFDMTAQVEDVTSHSSGAPFRQRITTLLSFGPITFPVNWVPDDSTHNATTGLLSVWKAREERTWKLTDPDVGDLVTFFGLVSDIKGAYSVAGVKSGSITIQASGEPTFHI